MVENLKEIPGKINNLLDRTVRRKNYELLAIIQMSSISKEEYESLINTHTWKSLDDHVARPFGLNLGVYPDEEKNLHIFLFTGRKISLHEFNKRMENFKGIVENPPEGKGEHWVFTSQYHFNPNLRKLTDAITRPQDQ